MSQFRDRGGADEAEEYVNNAEAEACDETGTQGHECDFFICRGAVLADGIDDDDAEYESGEGIHGAVAVKEALGKSFHRIDVVLRSSLPGSDRSDRCKDEEQGKECQKNRSDDFADTVDQFRRGDGEPPRNGEEDESEAIESHLTAFFREERSEGDFKRCRSRTGDSEGRPDGQVQGDGEENGVRCADTGSQLLQVVPGVTDGCNAKDWKPHACEQKADRSGNRFHT